MNVFFDYASYYNLLYSDKDYQGEAGYIHSLIERYRPGSKTVIELGCGTGKHALLLAEKGLRVHGIDMSHAMLAQARELLNSSPDKLSRRLSFDEGDVRTYRIDSKYDVAISLFHVMSYQTTNEDLQAAFLTAGRHLEVGGLFIFDVWYGPAVLSERPAIKVKRLENDTIRVTRIAEPELHENTNQVDVNFHVFVRNKVTDQVDEISEIHHMRYWFYPEIEKLLADEGLELIATEEWMSGLPLGVNTWGGCFIAKKVAD